ncbi:MAG: hypothetical protein ABSA18_01775 [Dehalococcoidia bacterium]|jgi:hypothetical protein
MSRVYILIAAILCMLPVFTIVSCAPPDINITSFQVIPSSILAGQTVVLKWDVSGAKSITIDNGLGEQPASGSIEIKPAQTTTYKLTAKNGNKSVESSIILTVNVPTTSPTTATEQVPSISALDTQELIRHIGEQVRVEGDVTYISSWLPDRLSGLGTSQPWTFMFFMKDVWEGAANNAGSEGEYCPECWRDYTSQFRVIIKPENLPVLLPILNNNFGGGFSLQDQWLIIGAADSRFVYIPSSLWSHGFVAQVPTHVVVQGEIVNYLSAPAIYLTQPGQISFSQP